jgi:carboxyl-terminal processing protease
MKRSRIDSELPVYSQVFTSPGGKRIGYIQLTTFDDETVPRKVRRALRDLESGGRLHGLILDNRYNEGGANTIFEDTLAYFKGGKLGYFVDRSGDKEALYVESRDISGSQQIPLVVLVGKDTASFGEIFSGILKDTQRAYLIGQTTDGNVEILYIYEFLDGSRALIAHDRFQPINHPEQNWEESGIIPDQTVLSNWDEVTQDTDPVIKAALEHFDQ